MNVEIFSGLLVQGQVILPHDAQFDELRRVWNGTIDRRPAAIVRCVGTSDVVACVAFARDHNLPVCVKGGGHNVGGLAVRDGALMLDMSHNRGVIVVAPSDGAALAHVQTGCLLGDVDRETQLHGLAAVLGFVSRTGVAGLTLGGGFGYLTRKFGWACDNVQSFEVVTADARVRRVSAHCEPDLFWALRGCGANFGVVTNIEYRLHRVGPEIVGGAIAWPASEASAIFPLVTQWMSDTNAPQLTCALLLRLAPAVPWLASSIHGQPIILVLVCDTDGDIDAALRRVAPIKALGAMCVGDTVQRRSYVSMQSLIDATQPPNRRYFWKSGFVETISPQLTQTMSEHAARLIGRHSAILLYAVGGALNRLPPSDHGAMGHRRATAVLNIMAAWEERDDDERNMLWAKSAWQALSQFASGVYTNFLSADDAETRLNAAFGENLDKLRELKTIWDPQNMFVGNNLPGGAGFA